MTTTGTAELVSTVIEKARRLIALNVKPVNNGIRCAICERTKRQLLGHFDGEGGCAMGDLADAVAAYDTWEVAVAESMDASAEGISEIEAGNLVTVEDMVAVITGHCFKCKDQRMIQNSEIVTAKNGRPMHKGSCPDCGSTITRFAKAELVPA